MATTKELTTYEPGLLARDEIEHCNRLHEMAGRMAEEARTTAERACHYAVVLGLRLKKLKAETPHGGWLSLFSGRHSNSAQIEKCAEFAFSADTATRYIRAAEGALHRPGLPAAKRREIEELAAAPMLPERLESHHHEALDLATRGETLRQLYLDLGVIKASAAEKGGGGAREKRAPGEDQLPEHEEVFRAFVTLCNPLSKRVIRGDLARLRPERLRELQDLFQSYVDDCKKIGR